MTDNINKKVDNEAVDLEKLEGVTGGATVSLSLTIGAQAPRKMGLGVAQGKDAAPTNGKLSLEEMNDTQTSDNLVPGDIQYKRTV